MPASRSPSRDAEPAPRSRSYWPIFLIGLAARRSPVIISALPASNRHPFLPRRYTPKILSGGIWHGSAGKIKPSMPVTPEHHRGHLHPRLCYDVCRCRRTCVMGQGLGFVVDIACDHHRSTRRAAARTRQGRWTTSKTCAMSVCCVATGWPRHGGHRFQRLKM